MTDRLRTPFGSAARPDSAGACDHAHVSDLAWDRHLAGELSAAASAGVLAQAAGCAICQARLAALTADHAAFAQRPLPTVQPRPRRAFWIGGTATALAAAAALVIFVRTRPDEPGARTKGPGEPALVLAAGRAPDVTPVSSGDVVRPGDSLQAAYTTTRDGFGAVLSQDGARSVSSYVPAQGDAMVPLPAGTDRSFPQSTVLDGVLGREHIIILWCERSLPLAPILAELRATGDVAAPTGCYARRIELDKR